MSKNIMIKCKEATAICDKAQYGEASFFDKIRLSLHNFLCKKCKLYSEQNKIMTKLLKVNKPSKCNHTLCLDDKKELQQTVEKKLSENN